MRLGSKNPPAEDSRSTNRSEEVRRRKTQRGQQRVSTAGHKITNPVNPRPVIVRGHARQGFPWENSPQKGSSRKKAPIVNTPIYSKAGTRARRQFYLTMDQASGSELRLPSLPMLRPGWRLLSGLIAIAMLFGVYSLYQSPYFLISTVEVQGLQRLTAQEVNDTLKLQNLSVIEINKEDVQKKLTAAYPELSDVQVDVEFPNYVTVSVAERVPVMAIQQGDKVTWVDQEGVLFPVRGDAGKLVTIHTEDQLPLAPAPIDLTQMDTQAANQDQPAATKIAPSTIPVTGPVKVDPALLIAAQALSKQLPPETVLAYSQQNGLGWVDTQGTQVYIGKDLVDFEAKYKLYQQMSQYVSDQGQKATLISVEHLNAPFYRLEQ